MSHARILPLCAFIGALIFAPALATAGHHTWKINEIYSDASGTVQFIEMTNANDNEQGLAAWSIVGDNGTFDFLTNLGSTATGDKSILIATDAAVAAGAPTPDYVMDPGFLDITGDSLNYANNADIVAFGALPLDLMSIDRNGVAQINSPTNFAGESGLVNAAFIPAAPPWALAALVLLLGASCMLALRRERVSL
jgi:hypothetical protein